MATRKCSKCGGENLTLTQRWCSSCKSNYDKEYYQRPGVKERHAETTRRNKEKLVQWYIEQKSRPCTDCNECFHHAAMQWDHIDPALKDFDIATLLARENKQLLIEEIAKCELVCANCHAIRTYNYKHALVSPQTSNLMKG